jgi:hypothetical protein
MTKNQFSMLILVLGVLSALTFIFVFDAAGESVGESLNPILSGTNRALTVEIALENWREQLPPLSMLTWNEPLYRKSLRESVPEVFPEDREALIFVDMDTMSMHVGVPALILNFQYDKNEFSHEEAIALLSRLADAYTRELAKEGIRAVSLEDHTAHELDFRPLFLLFIVIKASVAALTMLFIFAMLISFARPNFGHKKAVSIAGVVFLVGIVGLTLCNAELFLKSEFASYPPPSVLVGQKISVHAGQSETQSAGKYDWKTIPQSARYTFSILHKEDPSITLEQAQRYLMANPLSNPVEVKLMRGEQMAREPGWHFTVRIMTNVSGRKSEARDAWLAELFWQMKVGYESFLAEDGLDLSGESEVYTIEEFPARRAHTRARTLAAFGISALGFLGWIWFGKRPRDAE